MTYLEKLVQQLVADAEERRERLRKLEIEQRQLRDELSQIETAIGQMRGTPPKPPAAETRPQDGGPVRGGWALEDYLRAIDQHFQGEFYANELAEVTGQSPRTCRDALNFLVNRGDVRREGKRPVGYRRNRAVDEEDVKQVASGLNNNVANLLRGMSKEVLEVLQPALDTGWYPARRVGNGIMFYHPERPGHRFVAAERSTTGLRRMMRRAGAPHF